MTRTANESRWDRLMDAVASEQQRQVLEALEGADENERAELFPRLVELSDADERPFYDLPESDKPRWFALTFAVVATTPRDLVAELFPYHYFRRVGASDSTLGSDLVAQRSPEWRKSLRDRMFELQSGALLPLLNAIAEGYCEPLTRPTDPEELAQFHTHMLRATDDASYSKISLTERMAGQPWCLGWPVDLLFEVEGGSDSSLSAVDRSDHRQGTWHRILLALTEDGSLERERVIDLTFGALASDFAPFRAGWFQRFLRALKLSDSEALARAPQLRNLLTSPTPVTASIALEQLNRLQQAGELEAAGFVASVAPCLLHKAKKTPLLAMKMLALVAEEKPDLRADVGAAAVVGLNHSHVDVQSQALALLETLSDELSAETRERVAEATPFLSATLTQGRVPAVEVTAFRELGPPERLPAPIVEREPCGERVEPIDSIEAMVLEAVRHLEAPGDLIREERLLDALLRLPPPPPESAHAAALHKAVERAFNRPTLEAYGTGQVACEEMADVVYAWLALGQEDRLAEWSEPETTRHSGLRVFTERRESIVRRMTSDSAERLWSLPTHADGSIEAAEARERWAACPLGAEDPDRLILWARAAVELEPAPPDVVVSDALVVKSHPYPTGKWSWLAADPESTVRLPSVPGTLLISAEISAPSDWLSAPTLPDPLHIRSAASLCHRYPDVAMHLAAQFLAKNLDFSTAHWENRHFLEPLLWPGLNFGPLAHLALAVGLAAKENQERAIAIDACIEAAEEGRVRAAELGAAMAELLATSLPKAPRWAASLREVADASLPHAEFVARVVAGSLDLDSDTKPHGIGALLELLMEAHARTGHCHLPDRVRAYLGTFKGSSKGAKLAKSLLATPPQRCHET